MGYICVYLLEVIYLSRVLCPVVMTGSDRIREGQELRLTCRAEGPTVPTNIEWFINGKRIGREHENLSIRSFASPSEHSFTSELIIGSSRQEDSATYYCRSAPYSNVEKKTVIVSTDGRSCDGRAERFSDRNRIEILPLGSKKIKRTQAQTDRSRDYLFNINFHLHMQGRAFYTC